MNSVHIPTDENVADMLTKGLSTEVRLKLENCISGIAEEVAKASNKEKRSH